MTFRARIRSEVQCAPIEPERRHLYTGAHTMSKTDDRERRDAPLSKKLDELYGLIEGIEIAMFTTRRPDGHLVSRPDGDPDPGRGDRPLVRDRHRVAQAGRARVRPPGEPGVLPGSHPGVGFGERPRHRLAGSPGDPRALPEGLEGLVRRPGRRARWRTGRPRLALVLVDVQSVSYLKVDKPKPLVLFEVAKGMVTGTPPNVGAQRELTGAEIDRGPGTS